MTLGDQLQNRYPRIICSVARVHRMSEDAAVTAIVEYTVFGITDDTMDPQLAALGGPLAILQAAIRQRNLHPIDR